jgi:biotin carboxylase
MRPRLMLFVGTRGVRIADTCNPLTAVADVVVATSEDILAERSDRLDRTVEASDLVVAPHRGRLLEASLRFHAEHPVSGALTFSDDLVELTARFAARTGLPGQPPDAIPNFRDKYVQRRALATAGVPVPPFAVLSTPEQADAALAAVPLPAMVKPTRGSGGALAYVIDRPTDLPPVVAEAFGHAGGAGGAVEADTEFILEGLLVGAPWHRVPGFAPYVSVESAAVGGRYLHLGVTDRFPLSPPALETGMMLPSALDTRQQAEVVGMADRALRALDFRHGLAHTELMLTADGPRVIEVNARAGGALPYLFPLASDVDLIRVAGEVALGALPEKPPRFARHGVFVAPQHPVGVEVSEVRGLDAVRTLPGVTVVIPLALAGARTDRFQRTMIAAVLATAESPADAVRVWRDVMATVRADYVSLDIPDRYRRAPASTSAPGSGPGVVRGGAATMRGWAS